MREIQRKICLKTVLEDAGYAVVGLVLGVLAVLPGATVGIQPDVGALELEDKVVVDRSGIDKIDFPCVVGGAEVATGPSAEFGQFMPMRLGMLLSVPR